MATRTPTRSSDDMASKAKDVAATATDTVKQGVSEAQGAAVEQLGSVTHMAADKADERREQVADVARTLQDKAQEFARSVGQEQPQIGHLLDQAAGSVDRVVTYVENTPVEQMTRDFTSQMRKRPVLFAAGMFGAGFLLTRALKPVDHVSSSNQLGAGTQQRALPAASATTGGMH